MRLPRRAVPSFSLYGEVPAASRQTDGVHIEDIQSRSRKYLWKIATHRHTQLSQCILVTEGPVSVTLDEARANLVGPAVVIVPAGTVHAFRFRADTAGRVLTVDLVRLLAMADPADQSAIDALFTEPRAVDLRQDPHLATRAGQLLDQLAGEFRQPDSCNAPVCSWLACCVLWILGQGVLAQANSLRGGAANGAAEIHAGRDRLRRFRVLLESQYLKHWPVERYAQRLAISATSLNRLCRHLAGTTAFDLIQQRLALEARRRLVYAGSSVSGIARELGFKDPAYFSRFFRRQSGVTPNEFRRRHRGV